MGDKIDFEKKESSQQNVMILSSNYRIDTIFLKKLLIAKVFML